MTPAQDMPTVDALTPTRRTLYMETTIPSYQAARPSRDLIVAAHQQITHEWWTTARNRFQLYVSQAVLDEVSAGDPDAARRRLALVDGLPVLALTDDVAALAEEYERELGLPRGTQLDVLHLAYSVAHRIDFLLTWNCTHLANGFTIERLEALNAEKGRGTPIIVTPEELMEFPLS